MPIKYRGYWIENDPPPIPDRLHDWQWAHDGYDGPDDPRQGSSRSLEAAKADIDEQIMEQPQEAEIVSAMLQKRIYEDVSAAVANKVLVCRLCGSHESLSPHNVMDYFARGWPTCCMETMLLEDDR